MQIKIKKLQKDDNKLEKDNVQLAEDIKKYRL